MKIVAVPLACNANPAKLPYLTYLAYKSTKTASSAPGQAPARPAFSQRMILKASNFWNSLGRTDKRSLFDWRRRTYVLGEKIMDRIAYEEWALKGIDQVLGPSMHNLVRYTQTHRRGQDTENAKKDDRTVERVSLLYPPSLVSPPTVIESLRRMTTHRQPYHYRYLWYNVAGIVITSPLFIFPAVPNIITYYLLWRAWSHWRAYMASKSVLSLIQKNLIELQPEERLDNILASSPDEKVESLPEDWTMTVHPSHASKIQHAFELPEQASVDLRRACSQAMADIRKKSSS